MSLNNLKTRINFLGGSRQQDRMNNGKLSTLKKALLYSYQAATVVLPDGREFRCLINPNKISVDLDNKILSIPFKDVCLNAERVGTTSQGEVETGIKEGDVIEWKENGSHWLVYLRRLEETAYFRADLRRCRHQITLDNGNKYWVYIRGPVEQSLVWAQGGGNYVNQLNNTLQIYISQNEETKKSIHRFAKIKLNDNTWEVQAIDSISTPGIIEVSLKEASNNTPSDDIDKAVQNSINIQEVYEKISAGIYGPERVFPYETYVYEIFPSDMNGEWVLSNMSKPNMAKIVAIENNQVKINILTGKSGNFILNYRSTNSQNFSLSIKVESL